MDSCFALVRPHKHDTCNEASSASSYCFVALLQMYFNLFCVIALYLYVSESDRERKGMIFVPLATTATEFKDLCYYFERLPDFHFKFNSYRLLFENGVVETSAR